MTEQEITKLGFEKVKVSAEESGAEKFYYYVYKIGNIELISSADTEVEKPTDWSIEILEGGIEFHRIKELKIVIELMEINKKL
jgi:hypothetical protein